MDTNFELTFELAFTSVHDLNGVYCTEIVFGGGQSLLLALNSPLKWFKGPFWYWIPILKSINLFFDTEFASLVNWSRFLILNSHLKLINLFWDTEFASLANWSRSLILNLHLKSIRVPFWYYIDSKTLLNTKFASEVNPSPFLIPNSLLESIHDSFWYLIRLSS